MHRLLIAAFAAVSILVAGCAGLSLKDAALVGVHGKLLDAEFEAAALAVTSAPELNDAERAGLWRIVDALDTERDYLRTILDRPTGEQVVAAATACTRLEGIARQYSTGRAAFVGALEREGAAAPIMLEQYDASARLVYDGLHAQACEDDSPVQAADLVGYLGLGLRVIAATQGVPI